MAVETLRHNEPDEVDGPEDVTLPQFEHHTRIQQELNTLISKDLITADEADELFENWKND